MEKNKNIQIEKIKEKAEQARETEHQKRMIKYRTYNYKTKQLETRERVGKASKSSFRRIILLLFLIVVEIAVLVVFLTHFIITSIWVLSVLYGFGIIFAIRVAVSDSKSYDSKIAWIMFLLIFAPVAIFAYTFAGEMTATPLKSRRLKKIAAQTKFLHKPDLSAELPSRVKQDCTYIQNSSDYITHFSGTCEYFPTGEDFFEDVLARLQTAKDFIFIEFFILEKGQLANAIFHILTERVRAGVDVRIIVDGLGSHGALSWRKIRRMRKAGIKIIPFEPIVPIVNLLMNYRNHHKIIVIDGQIGYVGGINIADEYVNAKKKHGIWKDCGMRIEGEAVKNLTLAFLRMWEYSSKKKPDYEKFLSATKTSETQNTGNVILPYVGGPERKTKLCKEVYCNIISNARSKLYIMSPYFIVDRHMIGMLQNKAKSGVDVRLIIPGIPDMKLVYSLTLSNVGRMLDSGVKVYKYTPGFLHSKVVMSDDECAVVGSVNMDSRSFYQQYESAVDVANDSSINAIASDFEKTFDESAQLTVLRRRNIFVRIWFSFLRLFAPLM